MPLPWSAELAGRLDRHVVAFETLRGNPLGDPHERPLHVYVPPGYDDEPDRRVRQHLRHPGLHRPPRHVGQPHAVPAAVLRDRRPGVRQRAGAGRGRGLRRRLDDVRRLAVRRLPRHRRLPLLPLRRGRAVGRRALPDGAAARAPRDHGQVERRVRRVHHADAAAGPVRRARLARRRRAVRVLLPAGVRRRSSGRCGRTTATSRRFWTDFRGRHGVHQARPTAMLLSALGCSAAFSADPDGTPVLPFDPRSGRLREDVWARWLAWDPVRMVPDARRRAARAQGDLGRRRQPRRVLPRPRARRRSSTRWPRSA